MWPLVAIAAGRARRRVAAGRARRCRCGGHAPRRRRRARWKCAWWASSLPGTSTTPDSTAASAAPTRAFISAADPVGIDRNDEAGKDDFVLIGVLVVPVDRAVVVHLSSKDVIHGFTLATMRVKLDVTPGLPVTTWFTPIATGSWEVGCSQLCGLGHYRMRALFEVRTEAAWRAFVHDEVARRRKPTPRNGRSN